MSRARKKLTGRELAIVVSTAPAGGDLERGLALARAARALGCEVGMFFMHEAVGGLAARKATVSALADDGVLLVACATSAEALGATAASLPCPLGSQDDHAAIVQRAERLVALT